MLSAGGSGVARLGLVRLSGLAWLHSLACSGWQDRQMHSSRAVGKRFPNPEAITGSGLLLARLQQQCHKLLL